MRTLTRCAIYSNAEPSLEIGVMLYSVLGSMRSMRSTARIRTLYRRSHVEARTLELVFPNDTNSLGTIFGGTLVAWMDKAAAFAAVRRARNTCVTAAIEGISFQSPIRLGELVEIYARVESVGRTSLRVRVEVRRENPMDGSRELCTVGYFAMVSVDERGVPQPVPPAE